MLQAVANIAKFPWLNRETLYALSLEREIYSPARTLPPDAWALFLRFIGTDSSEQTSDDLMNGPGNFAIDERGFLWVNDNYIPQPRFDVACAGRRLLKFYPWGENFPGSPYFGGGLEGAGFGISIAPNGRIWVGNFGTNPNIDDPDSIEPDGLIPRVSHFCGVDTSKCPPSKQQPGEPISPPTGYTSNALLQNTGIAIDPSGNVWLANNWKEIPLRNNPAGNSIVVMVGAAGPLKTPLIGLPKGFDR